MHRAVIGDAAAVINDAASRRRASTHACKATWARESVCLFVVLPACCDARMALRMRLANVDDAAAISRLCRRVARRWVMPGQPPAAVVMLEETFSARVIRQRIALGLRFHLALVNDILVGVGAVRDNCHVFHLFVGTRYQGRGIGRKLWSRLKADGIRRADTRVFTLNASSVAMPVYLHLGFVIDHDPARQHRGKVLSTPMIYRVGGSD